MKREPRITVEGVPLTDAQAMSIRVAVESMRMELASAEVVPDLGTTYRAALGPIGDLYAERLTEVSRLLVGDGT